MKTSYPHLSIKTLCALFGKTRHAYYDYNWRERDEFLKEEIILQLIKENRINLPKVGTRKLQFLLKPQLEAHHIKVGRDYLFDLLSVNKMLIRNRRRRAITTDSRHWMRKYLNLIQGLEVSAPEQLWVSDITYIRLWHGFAYLSLITDAYSHKIMGFCLREDLSGQGCIQALKMALGNRFYPHRSLIHHSDRGSQYCSNEYVQILTDHKIAISMTQNGDPYENAIAERLNGIIKNEFNLQDKVASLQEARRILEKAILAYNTIRPHDSCERLTPQQAHLKTGKLKKLWKTENNLV